jgi:hypothetical protein
MMKIVNTGPDSELTASPFAISNRHKDDDDVATRQNTRHSNDKQQKAQHQEVDKRRLESLEERLIGLQKHGRNKCQHSNGKTKHSALLE